MPGQGRHGTNLRQSIGRVVAPQQHERLHERKNRLLLNQLFSVVRDLRKPTAAHRVITRGNPAKRKQCNISLSCGRGVF